MKQFHVSSRSLSITSLVALTAYVLLSLWLFFSEVEPWLMLQSDRRWGADSLTYIDYARDIDPQRELVSFSGNFLGPVGILCAVNHSQLAVVGVNYLVLWIAYRSLSRTLDLALDRLLWLLLLDPMTLVSLLTVNKEILSLLSVSLYVCYIHSRKPMFLLTSLATSVLVRWQCTLVFLAFAGLLSSWNPFRERRLTMIAGVTLALTLMLPLLGLANTDFWTAHLENLDDAASRFGVIAMLSEYDNRYLFFVSVIPKVALNLFGSLPRSVDLVWDRGGVDYYDLYSVYITPLHQIVTFSLCAWLVKSRRATLQSDFLYFCAFNAILFAATPFVQTRYFYPLHVVFCIELARRIPAPRQCALRKVTAPKPTARPISPAIAVQS